MSNSLPKTEIVPGGNPQKQQYDEIHDPYMKHYFDPTSMNYRRRFIFDPLFEGFDLSGKRVADICCGSGGNSLILREMFPGIRMEGFDLSERACKDYRSSVGAPAHVVDLTQPMIVDEPFDAVVVIGGLHHCVSNLAVTMANLTRMVRADGYLFFFEPNGRFTLERVRRLWYRLDPYFEADTERALMQEELEEIAKDDFVTLRTIYLGGPAYFLILQSLIFRIPLFAKHYIAPFLFVLERLWNRIPGKRAFPVFSSAWQRIAKT